MRDYKHVKVPRRYRSTASRSTVKRVEAGNGGRRKKAGAGLRHTLLRALFVVAAAGGAWLAWQGYRQLMQNEMFQVAGVDVQGVHRLNDAALRDIVGPFRGQNIFKADLQAAARRAQGNPWIREVRLHRSLPNRITMSVVERVPCAVLDSGAGRYLIDDEAVAIERVRDDDPAGRSLPVVSAPGVKTRPGEPADSDSVAEALALLDEIGRRGGWNMADVTVRAGSAEALSVVYAGREFKFGSGRYEEKLRRLAEILSDVKSRGVDFAYVDLRPETQAAVMVKQAAEVKKAGPNRGRSGRTRR